MQQIRTRSGTLYLRDDNKITRISERPIDNAAELLLAETPVVFEWEPQIDMPMRFKPAGCDQYVTTTTVMQIWTLP
jgi:hypothetical protein